MKTLEGTKVSALAWKRTVRVSLFVIFSEARLKFIEATTSSETGFERPSVFFQLKVSKFKKARKRILEDDQVKKNSIDLMSSFFIQTGSNPSHSKD